MSEKKQANPLVIGLLVAGIVGLLGFTVWKATAPLGTPSPAAPAATQTSSATLPETAARPQPGTEGEAAKPQVKVAPVEVATVNPFAPLHRTPRTGTNPMLPAPPSAAAAAPTPSGPTPAPLLISRDRQRRAAALAALSSSERASVPPSGMAPMPVSVEPQLVGTMLGDRPTAMFKGEKNLVMVAEGGAYMGWRVLRVGHGEAVVWNGAANVRLRVGAPSTPVPTVAQAATQPPDGYATANYVVVRRAEPTAAPSRQELVYGRIEEKTAYGSETSDADTGAEPPETADAPPPISDGPDS